MPTYPLKKLSELFEIERGGSPRPIEKFLTSDSDGINWIKIGDTKNVRKYIYQTEQKIIPEGVKRSRMVYEDDFILSNSMSFGRPYIMKTKGCIHDGWLVLRNKLKGQVDQDYLYYVLSSDYVFSQFDSLAAGSTVRNLNISLVKSVKILLPPLPVQKEIVAKLDASLASIDEAKTKTEQALAATRELWESTLEQAFHSGDGWQNKKLEDVCDRIMDGTHFSPKNSTTGERLYVSAKNIKLHGVDFTKATYISEADHKIIYKRCPVKKGDVLYIKDGATTGIATINNLDEEFSLLSSVAVFQVTKKLLLEQFLVYYLNSGFGKKHMLGMIDGTAITRLTLTKLNSGIIPLPPLPKQSNIVAHLDAVRAETDRLASLYEKKLADLDELRRSVLQEAFAQNT